MAEVAQRPDGPAACARGARREADDTDTPAVLVVGVGNALRHDDAAGLLVARRVGALARSQWISVLEHEGETLGLLERWSGVGAVVLVDAVRSGAEPGTIHRIDAAAAPIPARLHSSSSTHAVGLGEAIELARQLGRLPARIVLYGVEGARFDAGSGLSPAVSAAIPPLAERLVREAIGLAAASGPA